MREGEPVESVFIELPKRAEEKRVSKDVLSVALLDEIAERLANIQEYFDKNNEQLKTLNNQINLLQEQLELSQVDFLIKFAPRVKIYSYKTVEAGKSETIFDWDLIRQGYDRKFMLIITHVANLWLDTYDNVYMEWHRDYSGAPDFRRPEVERIEYSYGSIDNPKEIIPWIPIFSNHKWIAYNNDNVSHIFEVLMYGFIFPREYFMKIMDKIWDGYK